MKYSVLIFTLIVISTICFGQTKQIATKSSATSKTVTSKFGALAIDRSNGFYYGWSHDYSTLTEAEQKAIEECKKMGGNCSVVLSYSGTGCAAYRTIKGNVGTAFGWGVAKTKAEADAIAIKECEKRSNGNPSTNFVWSCNGVNSGTLKEIYNASEEIAINVKIGNQYWANKNLDVATFRNGDIIKEAKSTYEWEDLFNKKLPAWCYYKFDAKNGQTYGKIYNWYAVIDQRGLAPVGYHIPSKNDWDLLCRVVGSEYVTGSNKRYTGGEKLKALQLWSDGKATNESKFSALPGGYIDHESIFRGIGTDAKFWSNTLYTKDNFYSKMNITANYRFYLRYDKYMNKEEFGIDEGTGSIQNACYVRCIKD